MPCFRVGSVAFWGGCCRTFVSLLFQVLLALKCPQQNGWVCSRVMLEEVPCHRWDEGEEAFHQDSPQRFQLLPFPPFR